MDLPTRDVTIRILEQTPCVNCQELVPLEDIRCASCGNVSSYFIGLPEVLALLEDMMIMDARYGGYVIGRTGPEDDIPMVQPCGGAIYRYAGLMQGGEYILSEAAAFEHRELLDEINSETGDVAELPEIAFTDDSHVINTNLMPVDGRLLISGGGQYIVNRFATVKHFASLERLNKEAIAQARA